VRWGLPRADQLRGIDSFVIQAKEGRQGKAEDNGDDEGQVMGSEFFSLACCSLVRSLMA
jgi:hypothetical protein